MKFATKQQDSTNVPLQEKILEKYPSFLQFAKAISKSTVYVSQVVQGKRNPPILTKLQWAKKLGCDTLEIFTKQGGKKSGR